MKLFKPEVIGDPACPILHRWTLLPPLWGNAAHSRSHGGLVPDWLPKLLLHHFMPHADERHFHDHPRAFITIVLRGGYDDMAPCSNCDGDGFMLPDDWVCPHCQGKGILRERMRAGMVRYRPARHTHRTRVLFSGCWSIVLMGPMVRQWGFWVDGVWKYWEEYKQEFGHGMRCS